MRKLFLILAVVFCCGGLMLTGCKSEESPGDKAKDAMDKAGDTAKEAVDSATTKKK